MKPVDFEMNLLEAGQHIADIKALAYADSETGTSDSLADSFVLILADEGPITITSATDWTLQVERGAWPSLPSWAWPPESWQYHDVDSPIGSTGFQEIRSVSELFNEVGEIIGVEISFDDGALRLSAGESVTYQVDRR